MATSRSKSTHLAPILMAVLFVTILHCSHAAGFWDSISQRIPFLPKGENKGEEGPAPAASNSNATENGHHAASVEAPVEAQPPAGRKKRDASPLEEKKKANKPPIDKLGAIIMAMLERGKKLAAENSSSSSSNGKDQSVAAPAEKAAPVHKEPALGREKRDGTPVVAAEEKKSKPAKHIVTSDDIAMAMQNSHPRVESAPSSSPNKGESAAAEKAAPVNTEPASSKAKRDATPAAEEEKAKKEAQPDRCGEKGGSVARDISEAEGEPSTNHHGTAKRDAPLVAKEEKEEEKTKASEFGDTLPATMGHQAASPNSGKAKQDASPKEYQKPVSFEEALAATREFGHQAEAAPSNSHKAKEGALPREETSDDLAMALGSHPHAEAAPSSNSDKGKGDAPVTTKEEDEAEYEAETKALAEMAP